MPASFSSVAVDIEKLRDYCLSASHPRGRHKARIFRSRLGLTAADAVRLRDSLLEAMRRRQNELQPGDADEFGQRHVLDFELTTAVGSATIRSLWIQRTGVLRFVSCYVL